LEDIKSQLRVLGEGMQMLNEKMDSKFAALESANSEEHRLIMQMVRELSEEQQKLKRAK